MNIRKRQWFIVLALVLTTALLVACGAKETPTPTPPPTKAPTPTPVVSQPEATPIPSVVEATPAVPQPSAPTRGAVTGLQAFELALPLAHGWQADARLMELATTIMAPLATDGTCEVWTVNFYSVSAKAQNNVMVQNGKAAAMGQVAGEYDETRLIDPSTVKLDSAEAIKIAEENGGSEYSAQEGTIPTTSLNYHALYEKPIWTVNYLKADYTVAFTVHIDAAGGEVLFTG